MAAADRRPGGIRRLAVDLAPLRSSRDYRLLWMGELVSKTGYQITVVAVFVQIYELTGSAAAVGLVGIVQLGPLMLTSLFGSPLVDTHDRRLLLLFAEMGLVLTSSLLLLGATMDRPPLFLLYLAVGMSAGLNGLEMPTRWALIPNLVGRDQLSSAFTLHQIMWNTIMIVGPAIAGLIIARFGLVWAYGIDVLSYAATILSVAFMRPAPPRNGGPERMTGGGGRMSGVHSLVVTGGPRLGEFQAGLLASVLGATTAVVLGGW